MKCIGNGPSSKRVRVDGNKMEKESEKTDFCYYYIDFRPLLQKQWNDENTNQNTNKICES